MTRVAWGPMLAIALAPGAVQAQLHAIPVTAPDAVYEFPGYSVQAPPGKDWFELRRDARNVFFGKKLVSRTHALIATALSAPITEKFDKPENFRDYVAKAPLERDDRSTLLEHRVELDDSAGGYCVRFYTRALDRGAVNARGNPLLLETYGVSCLHPADAGVAVTVSYSERGELSETSAELRAQGERFVASLKFTGLAR